MQDEGVQKPAVLIASGLKPVQDSRAFEKLGLSLRETNKYSLNFIGFSAKTTFKQDGIRFFSSISHTKSLVQRLKMPFRFLSILLKIRPQLVICCTWEFLPFAKFFRPLLSYRLIYDVQENYCLNLNLNPDLSSWKKILGKKLIRWAEKGKGIDYFILAEDCYALEMPEKRPYLTLENRYAGPSNLPVKKINLKDKQAFHFVMGGTITPAFGSTDAIRWFDKILKAYPDSTLRMIGHVPLRSHFEEIKKTANATPNLILNLSEEPIDHGKIMEAFQQADFILMPYQNHPEISSKMPTKLFEAAALGIPVLFSPNPKWQQFISGYQGGHPVNFQSSDNLLFEFQQLLKTSFFIQNPPDQIFWESQKTEFLACIESL